MMSGVEVVGTVLSAISFDHIREARQLDREIFVHHIFSKPELLDELAEMGNAGLSCNYQDLSTVPAGLVERVHAAAFMPDSNGDRKCKMTTRWR